jgi:Transposase and inactivated derivatives
LTDLKARGVEDILVTATDNLKGFTEAIRSVFPLSTNRSVSFIRSEMPAVLWSGKTEKRSLPT